MRKSISVLVLLTVFTFVRAQSSTDLPSVDIKNLKGEVFNTSEIKNDGPVLISFWATWCKPCIKELIAVNENLEDWQEETGVKVYAVSVDDSKSMNRVAPFVNGRAWDCEVLLDPNGDFKRAMNVINVPHSFLLDKNGKIVWQHTSYAPGDEDELYEKLVKLSKGEKIN